MAKVKKSKEVKIKTKSIFNHSDAVFSEQDPNYFDKMGESDKKSWTNYMINRILSMQPNYVGVINMIQKYSPILKPELYYKVLIGAIPKTQRQWNPYIKARTEIKFEPEIVGIFCKHFEIGSSDALDYLQILSVDLDGQAEIKRICDMYGEMDKKS